MKDLYKILSGKVFVKLNGSIITVGPFSFDALYLAELEKEKAYSIAFSEGLYTEDEALNILIENGDWSSNDEEEILKIPTVLEQMKLDYFNQFYKPSSKDYIKYNIDYQRSRLNSLLNRKFSLSQYTCEYLAEETKLHFLIENFSTCNNIPVDWSRIPLTSVINLYLSELLNDESIRDIAKSSEFRFLWASNKELIKSEPISQMKTSLISWAQVYDNVYESTECPSDDIIQDNLALDGWFIMRRKKREEERKKNAQDSGLSPKMAQANELFISYKTPEDLQAIYNMNNMEAKMKLKQLNKDLDTKGVVQEKDLSSNKLELGLLKNKLQREAMNAKH